MATGDSQSANLPTQPLESPRGRLRSPVFAMLRRFGQWLTGRKPRNTHANASTFGGMTYEQFSRFAAQNPPPQEWHEEDVRDLRGRPR
jgi:hypothetical protein